MSFCNNNLTNCKRLYGTGTRTCRGRKKSWMRTMVMSRTKRRRSTSSSRKKRKEQTMKVQDDELAEEDGEE